MIKVFASEPASPRERGASFGEHWRAQVGDTVEGYRELFAAAGGDAVELDAAGAAALAVIDAWAPALGEEIEGLAAGAGLPPSHIAAINARTEILASAHASARGECSTVVCLRSGESPLSVQTWDWHDRFEDNWLVWTVELPDGRRWETVTEFGILAKIGVNDAGVGVHLNYLRHRSDRREIGVPVHIVARRILGEARDVEQAMKLIRGASVSASSVLTLVAAQDGDSTAFCAELYPDGPAYVLPDSDGILVHTNHFLHPNAISGDLEAALAGDSYFRYELLRRRLVDTPPATSDDVITAMSSHLGGAGAVCCHCDPAATLGDRYATLATVSVDVAGGTLDVRRGGPCGEGPNTTYSERLSFDSP